MLVKSIMVPIEGRMAEHPAGLGGEVAGQHRLGVQNCLPSLAGLCWHTAQMQNGATCRWFHECLVDADLAINSMMVIFLPTTSASTHTDILFPAECVDVNLPYSLPGIHRPVNKVHEG